MSTTEPARGGIQAFCGTEDIRSWMHRPWMENGCVYATNGHACVEVWANAATASLLGAVSKPKRSPDMAKLFSCWPTGMTVEPGTGTTVEPGFIALPSLPEFQACQVCYGDGYLDDDPLQTCGSCCGYGEKFELSDVYGLKFQVHYLRLIASLPDVKVSMLDDRLLFRFGYDACVMSYFGRGILMCCKP